MESTSSTYSDSCRPHHPHDDDDDVASFLGRIFNQDQDTIDQVLVGTLSLSLEISSRVKRVVIPYIIRIK